MAPRHRAASAAARVRALDPALLLLAGMVFVVQVGVAVMLPLLPLYARSLGASPTVLGLLTSVFAVTNAGGQFLTGFLSERLAMRRVLAAGIGSYAVANFLIAGAGSAGALIAFRGFAGLGGGVMIVGERLYLTQLVEASRLAFANGVLSAAGSAGSVAGPALGGLLATLGDLRTPFLLVGVTSLLATIGALFLPRPPSELPGGGSPQEDAATAAAELQRAGSLSEHRPSDRRRLLVLLLAQIGLMSSFGAFITTYGPFAEERLGWITAEIGLVFAAFGLGAIIFGPWLGGQADRFGRRNVAILASLPVLAFSAVYWIEAPRLVLYASALVAGGGLTGVTASWYALLADATGGGRKSRQFATVAALGNLGIIIGATVSAQLWEALDDVSVGLLVAGGSVVVTALSFALLPADRPGRAAGT
ncbi:MAG TPA: MFS transporter [Candidatus Limnocylindrales bacterium]|nr:MFS transporter [Candidatus Limnocylindrales bacterium]